MMCDAQEISRQWWFYVRDMIGFCERVLVYTGGMDQSGFVNNSLVYDATLRNIELIGEAATRIPEHVRQAHSEILWRAIIGARNRIIHFYLGLDDDTVWSIIVEDIPALLPRLRRLLEDAD